MKYFFFIILFLLLHISTSYSQHISTKSSEKTEVKAVAIKMLKWIEIKYIIFLMRKQIAKLRLVVFQFRVAQHWVMSRKLPITEYMVLTTMVQLLGVQRKVLVRRIFRIRLLGEIMQQLVQQTLQVV